MILGKNNWRVFPTLKTAVVAIAICVLPQGAADAQDFEAVERRLGGGVEAGELTLEQASVMLEVLREFAEEQELRKKEERFEDVVRDLEMAVKKEEISQEEAEERYEEARRKIFGDDFEEEEWSLEERERAFMEESREIREALKAGKIGEEEAEEMIREMHEELFGDHDEVDEEDEDWSIEKRKHVYMEESRAIKKAVKAGKISEEEAEELMLEMREELFGDHDEEGDHEDDGEHEGGGHDEDGHDHDDEEMAAKKKRYIEAAKKIKGMVAEGKVSKEDAETRLIQMRTAMFGDAKAGAKEANQDRGMRGAKRIRQAIKDGKISKEDGEKRLQEMRQRMSERDRP